VFENAFNSLVCRNLYDPLMNLAPERVRFTFGENTTSDMVDETTLALNLRRRKLFQTTYRIQYDSVDNYTHLVRLYELFPSIVGKTKR